MRLSCPGRRSGIPLTTAVAATLFILTSPPPAPGLTVDRRGEMTLGGRAYTAVRIGTQTMGNRSFPESAAGHVRQQRNFLEIEWNHNLMRLYREGKGLPALLRLLPVELDTLRYNVTYRGEHEGIYDYGPDEFSRGKVLLEQADKQISDLTNALSPEDQVALFSERLFDIRRRLRRVGTQRHRLFQFFLELEKDPVFVRIGRQNLVWGETDSFRLLDNINPLDNGFGGFFIDLDERRVPLDMIRTNVRLRRYGPISEAFVEGFLVFDDAVAHKPGIPLGSPWQPALLGLPRYTLERPPLTPARNFEDVRGGARLVFNVGDATFSLAHYYTYLDTPAVRLRIPEGLPSETNLVRSEQSAPRVQITGASFSLAVPALYAVARGEFAFFRDEAIHRQSTLDPFCAVHPNADVRAACPDGLKPDPEQGRMFGFPIDHEATDTPNHRRDSLNFNLGWDMNRYIRFLNPHQTFFFTTQIFIKHIIDAPDDLVEPVPVKFLTPQIPGLPASLQPILEGREPELGRRPQTSVLQTLAITTAYRSGQVEPRLTLFYDWLGAALVQPGVMLRRDPLRLRADYTLVTGNLRELGFYRDRDNVRVQLEYVF